ncbi:unnamed protein product, partial [Prorocentrum cordatum]
DETRSLGRDPGIQDPFPSGPLCVRECIGFDISVESRGRRCEGFPQRGKERSPPGVAGRSPPSSSATPQLSSLSPSLVSPLPSSLSSFSSSSSVVVDVVGRSSRTEVFSLLLALVAHRDIMVRTCFQRPGVRSRRQNCRQCPHCCHRRCRQRRRGQHRRPISYSSLRIHSSPGAFGTLQAFSEKQEPINKCEASCNIQDSHRTVFSSSFPSHSCIILQRRSWDVRGNFLQFDGRRLHCTRPFSGGDRFSAVFFACAGHASAPPWARSGLAALGFALPPVGGAPARQRRRGSPTRAAAAGGGGAAPRAAPPQKRRGGGAVSSAAEARVMLGGGRARSTLASVATFAAQQLCRPGWAELLAVAGLLLATAAVSSCCGCAAGLGLGLALNPHGAESVARAGAMEMNAALTSVKLVNIDSVTDGNPVQTTVSDGGPDEEELVTAMLVDLEVTWTRPRDRGPYAYEVEAEEAEKVVARAGDGRASASASVGDPMQEVLRELRSLGGRLATLERAAALSAAPRGPSWRPPMAAVPEDEEADDADVEVGAEAGLDAMGMRTAIALLLQEQLRRAHEERRLRAKAKKKHIAGVDDFGDGGEAFATRAEENILKAPEVERTDSLGARKYANEMAPVGAQRAAGRASAPLAHIHGALRSKKYERARMLTPLGVSAAGQVSRDEKWQAAQRPAGLETPSWAERLCQNVCQLCGERSRARTIDKVRVATIVAERKGDDYPIKRTAAPSLAAAEVGFPREVSGFCPRPFLSEVNRDARERPKECLKAEGGRMLLPPANDTAARSELLKMAERRGAAGQLRLLRTAQAGDRGTAELFTATKKEEHLADGTGGQVAVGSVDDLDNYFRAFAGAADENALPQPAGEAVPARLLPHLKAHGGRSRGDEPVRLCFQGFSMGDHRATDLNQEVLERREPLPLIPLRDAEAFAASGDACAARGPRRNPKKASGREVVFTGWVGETEGGAGLTGPPRGALLALTGATAGAAARGPAPGAREAATRGRGEEADASSDPESELDGAPTPFQALGKAALDQRADQRAAEGFVAGPILELEEGWDLLRSDVFAWLVFMLTRQRVLAWLERGSCDAFLSQAQEDRPWVYRRGLERGNVSARTAKRRTACVAGWSKSPASDAELAARDEFLRLRDMLGGAWRDLETRANLGPPAGCYATLRPREYLGLTWDELVLPQAHAGGEVISFGRKKPRPIGEGLAPIAVAFLVACAARRKGSEMIWSSSGSGFRRRLDAILRHAFTGPGAPIVLPSPLRPGGAAYFFEKWGEDADRLQ